MIKSAKFEAVYDKYKRLVYNLALSYVQSVGDAEDITQETFVKIYQHLDRYDENAASMKTWIYRITINQSLDFIKAKKAKKRFATIVSLFRPENHEPVDALISCSHPGVALEDREALHALLNLINRLPNAQKTALILTKVEDRPHKEAAEIMNISLKALESLLQRGKCTLAKKLMQK